MNDQQRQRDSMDREVGDRLRGFAPSAPDRVWDRIERQLDERRRRPAAWLWWLAAGIFLGLAGWQLSRENIKKVEDRVSPIALQEEKTSIPLSGQTYRQAIVEGQSTPSLPKKVVPQSLKLRLHSYDSSLVSVINSGNKTSNQFSGQPNSFQAPLFPLDSKLRKVASSTALKSPGSWVFTPAPILRSPKPNRRLELGISVGPTWMIQSDWNNPNTNGQNLVFAETVHTTSDTRLGLNLGVRLNRRWRIEAGLSRQNSVQHTSHSANLRLMDGICLNPHDPGIKNYEFQYSLLSGANRSDVTVRIAQVDPHVSMPDDEPFILQMHTTRRSVDWLLPVSVQRVIGRGRWQAYVRGGVALGWSGRSSLEITHFTEQCVDLCFATGHIPQVIAARVENLSVHYLTGAGLQYQITPRIRLAVEPVLNGSLINFRGNGRQTQLALNGQAIYTF